MDLAAKHIGFVLASYAVAFTLLALLVVLLLLRMRTVRRRLRVLEEQGARRRAAARPAGARAGTGSNGQDAPARHSTEGSSS